jgi:hypothetical protein
VSPTARKKLGRGECGGFAHEKPGAGEDARFHVTSFERRPKALTFPTTSTAAPFQRASIVCRQSQRDVCERAGGRYSAGKPIIVVKVT